MRLSEWRAASPAKGAADPKVNAVVDPVLRALGAGPDADAWVAWGDEPATRYTIFVVTPAGLVTCFVRANIPGEGPRASAKLIRWNRVQVGELAVETQGSHRLMSFQVEGQVLKGADEAADRAASFALLLISAIDGREPPARDADASGRAQAGAARGRTKTATGARTKRSAAARGTAKPDGAAGRRRTAAGS